MKLPVLLIAFLIVSLSAHAQYSFEAPAPDTIVYYRIKAIHKDGHVTYSNVVKIDPGEDPVFDVFGSNQGIYQNRMQLQAGVYFVKRKYGYQKILR
jgi:hypothetical protein